MADGLSIAASVAGLVSLGFQVCSGITTYLDGLKCRAEELESARKYEQSLKASIQTIDKILSQPNSHYQNSSTDIAECIKPCKDELKALEGLVAELCGDKKTNPSLLDKAKASKKRLTYAFDRPKLSQLQAKVGQAIQSLQLALQILGLASSSSLGHTLQTIENTSRVTAAEIVAARADVTALAGNVSTLRDEAPLIRAAVEKIGPSLLDLDQLANQSVQGMQAMREDANLASHMLATKMEFMINQLAALQSQSTINQHATTKLLQQQDNRRLFNQMISRPSYLEEISEECFDARLSKRDPWKVDRTRCSALTMTARDGGSSDSVIQSQFGQKCTCRARKRLQRKQVVWSGISFFQDDVYSEKHFPTCQFWQDLRPAERKWGLRRAGIWWLAQKAIEITFCCRSGAGGSSFSPNFTYYHTVNENIAPSFRLVRVMYDAMRELIHQRHFDCGWQCILERGFKLLETLFREGRTSPNDMNNHNQTLIYPLSRLIWRMLIQLEPGDPSKRIMLDFVKGIIGFDIPSNIYDTDGESPIESLTAAFYITSIEAVEILFDGYADVPSLSISQENTFNHFSSEAIYDSIILQMESQMIAEAYGCGQLSQAVLAGDSKQVERLLQKDHASTMEVNCWGQTPLHLSISQPVILQVLLQYCGPLQLNELDNNGYTALNYALLSSFKLCRGGYITLTEKCYRKCRCTRPLELLLKADCAVDICALRGLDDYEITRKCQCALIRGLKDRRKRLKQLALDHLSDSDIVALNLRTEYVLDAQTATVIGLLEAKRVQIPPALMLTRQDKPAKPNGFHGVSVYHIIRNVHEADLFWSNGFLDFDVSNGHFDEVRGDGLSPIATCQDIDMIMWLFDHGANLLKELEPSNDSADRKSLCVRSAHFVYRKIGDWLSLDIDRSRQDILWPLHATVLAFEVLDKCECSCSKQGCTPFLMMVKALNPPYDMEKRRSNIFIVEPFLKYLRSSSYGLTRVQYKEAVRYFSFTALDMSHTCHHKPENSWDFTFTCSTTIEMCENARQIQDEQADMIELLEEMLFDLEAKLDDMMEDDEEFDMGIFLKDHWLLRVEKELEAISSHELPEDLKRDTEALGVVWDEATKETDLDSEDAQDKSLQYWLDAIDRAAQL